MREIKFRAWDENIGPKGSMVHHQVGVHNGQFFNSYFVGNLMQFTGIKDKDGKEIYEGDFVRFNTRGGKEIVYEVRWSDYHAGFKPTRLTHTNYQEMTVIGNIYENPDLLTQ